MKRIHSIEFLDPNSRTSKGVNLVITLIVIASLIIMIFSFLSILKSRGRDFISDVLFLLSIAGISLSCFIYFISYVNPEVHMKHMEVRSQKLLAIINDLNAQFLGKRNSFWKMGPAGAYIIFNADYSINVALNPDIIGLRIVQDGVDIMDEERRRSLIHGISYMFGQSAKTAVNWKKKMLSMFDEKDFGGWGNLPTLENAQVDKNKDEENPNRVDSKKLSKAEKKESMFRKHLRVAIESIEQQPESKVRNEDLPLPILKLLDSLTEKKKTQLLKEIDEFNPEKVYVQPKRHKDSISSV